MYSFDIRNVNTNKLFRYVYDEATMRKTPNDARLYFRYVNNFISEDVEESRLFM